MSFKLLNIFKATFNNLDSVHTKIVKVNNYKEFLVRNDFSPNLSWCIYKKLQHKRLFHSSVRLFEENEKEKKEKPNTKALVKLDEFDRLTAKNRDSYIDMIRIYEGRTLHRRGHVEFILSALKHMDEFGVEKDLSVYKKLIDVFPKGKFIPTNLFQVEFMHYPKQQQAAIDILAKMEENGVLPDPEVETMLLNIFGRYGHPVRKVMRMMYWLPKFKNLSPWPVPKPPPDSTFELAHLAIKRITSVDLQSVISVYQGGDVEDSIDDTWIVSGQSPSQKELLNKHPSNKPVIVEGGYQIWLRNKSVMYFVLKAELEPPRVEPVDTDDIVSMKSRFTLFNLNQPEQDEVSEYKTVHEQDNEIIYCVCATGSSTKDSLLSWIRSLQNENHILSKVPVLFRLRSSSGALVPFVEELVPRDR